jgi:hypothetical protein
MEERLTTSIVLYGNFDASNSLSWRDFYNYTTGLIESLKLNPNYLGLTGQSFKTGKVSLLSKTHKKLFKALEDREELVSMAIYSLPEDFKTAAFDYNVYICRTKQSKHPHLIATFSDVLFETLNHDEVIAQLKRFIHFESGQVFQLKNLESPQIYASKANSLTAFKSLKIIEELT